MKKAKNDAKAENTAMPEENKQKNKAAKGQKNVPSDKIRGNQTEERELLFKKVLYGYDPEEVNSYISELSATYEASARNHEAKLSSMKEELVLSNRERDSYGEKYRECKAKLEGMSEQKPAEIIYREKEDRSAEYEAVIEKLKGRIEQVEFENSQLRQASEKNDNGSKTLDEYIGRIALLEEENRKLGINADAVSRENAELLVISQKYESLFGEYNEIIAKLELSKAESESKSNEIQLIKEELEKKSEELSNISSEKENMKKKSAELEVENGVLKQRLEEKENEILRLRDINKSQAYEYADKINLLESEQAKSRLAMQKELKLHDYYINQAEITLSELSKQMEQIKQSLNDAQSV